ncbi:MAG: VOC family protein [Bdellovibrionales bacterium]
MIKGYKDFYYNVTDMNRAVRFYTEALGMKKSYGHEHWTTMEVGNLQLGLHWTEGEKIPSTPRDSHGQHCGGTLTFHSDNISEDRRSIEAAGGKILGETNADWGHMLVFEDLDGNVMKLMKPNH